MNQLSKAEDPDVVCLQLVSSLVRDEDAASAVLISMLGLVRIIHRNLVRVIRRNIHLRSRLGPNGPGASMSAWRIPRRFHRASAAPAKQKILAQVVFLARCRSRAPLSAHWALWRAHWTWNGCPTSLLRPSGYFDIHATNLMPISSHPPAPRSNFMDGCFFRAWLR
ncbi:hypothetical protein M440DRAFT_1261613 [Trichoderma longibrachiatum ATCC 18648]|uniref:Uncharacterized protein n=1 Tax=Trichoderma longibrachiatum ATCC 18648 TaxID=983965 RepID=A0A2T4C2M0_TRILO|nr:hypothetical protein M440DRAFT_1261613 [Trichoderma longibrachiatum ATCC 18648]